MQQYITEVLNNNPSLRSVAASAKAAAYGINITKAETLPHADLNFTRNQGKDSLTKETSRSASASVDVNWALDVWGRLSDDAAAAQFLSAKVKYGLLQSKRVFIIQAVQAWVEYSNFYSY
jgi:outer membrane protein TolC